MGEAARGGGTQVATAAAERVTYRTTVREMPMDERPRERLAQYGPSALQTAELLAIILRVGTRQENVVELSARLLHQYGGLGGLAGADFGDLCGVFGMGEAKAAQLKAALELGRRLSIISPGRPQITRPDDVASLLMTDMCYLAQEQLRVLCLDTPPSRTEGPARMGNP
jgi:DNA repair protein RadC